MLPISPSSVKFQGNDACQIQTSLGGEIMEASGV